MISENSLSVAMVPFQVFENCPGALLQREKIAVSSEKGSLRSVLISIKSAEKRRKSEIMWILVIMRITLHFARCPVKSVRRILKTKESRNRIPVCFHCSTNFINFTVETTCSYVFR